jgi:DNA-binding response OmpR family regulator
MFNQILTVMNKEYKILYIEDNSDLAHIVKQFLEMQGYKVTLYADGQMAYNDLMRSNDGYDLVLIDVELPGITGFELAERMTDAYISSPFLFLTGRTTKEDRIKGLTIGAYDYITKPFDIEELILRIRNIINRPKPIPVTIPKVIENINIGDILFEKTTFQVTVPGNKTISLTKREAALLEYLYEHANRTVKREDILISIWGKNDYFLGRSLDTFISRLRKLLKNSNSVSIDNVYGVGFIFNVKANAN